MSDPEVRRKWDREHADTKRSAIVSLIAESHHVPGAARQDTLHVVSIEGFGPSVGDCILYAQALAERRAGERCIPLCYSTPDTIRGDLRGRENAHGLRNVEGS